MTSEEHRGAAVEAAAERIRCLTDEIGRMVVGQRRAIREVIIALIAGGHVLIEGVPGLGKTLLVKSLSRALSAQFSRIQFTPDLMPSDVTGHAMFDMQSQKFEIRRGPVFCQLLLADEINRAPAKTQAALLEVMQEMQVTIEGRSFVVDPPFMVLATQNPLEQEGTYPLPEAQVDRFMVKIRMHYPPLHEEAAMVGAVTARQIGETLDVGSVESVLTPPQVVELQRLAAAVHVDHQVVDYAVRLVHATRRDRRIAWGAGPRGSIALVRAAKAQALCTGNDFVVPDDIKRVAPAVLRHRLSLTPDMEIEGVDTDEVIDRILQDVEVPRQ